jgi:hypothetical protein
MFATAEHDRHFHFAAVQQEAFRHLRFDFVIVRVDLRPELHLAQFPVLLFLARVFVFFRLLVLQSTVITDSTDWRHGGGRHLDQIEALRPRHSERFFGRHDAELRAFIVDHPNGANADLVVDT